MTENVAALEGRLWTPAKQEIATPELVPGYRPDSWRRDAAVAELIRHLDEHARRYKNWEYLSNSDRYATLSKEEFAAVCEQIQWCQEDFSYAARNYFWITNNDGRDQLFTLWESQYLVLQKYYDLKSQGKPQKIFILKARQLGCSLLIEAMMAWRTMFTPNIDGLIVSVDADHSAYLFGLMLHIYDRLPWWLRPEKAGREEKNGIWFNNPNEDQRATDPGLDSHVYVQWSTQYSGVGQGRKLLAAHCSEVTDWYQPSVRSIIQGDLKPAVKDSVESFWFVETTGKGAGSATHRLWRACEKMAEEAELYPLFLPYFFESSRKRNPPQAWSPQRDEIAMRERVKLEWVRCEKCQQFFYRTAFGRDRNGENCPSCKEGAVWFVELSNEQLYWKDVARRQAKENGEDSLKEHLIEFASTAEEAFQVSGVAVFGPECQDAVTRTILDPEKVPGVKVGFIDRNQKFHGVDGTKPDFNNPGKFRCFLSECNYDHQWDMDQHNVTMWEPPQPKTAYSIGVDISEGIGQDYSVIFVTKLGSVAGMPDEQVCILRDNHIEPLDLAFFCVTLGHLYNDAMLAIEYNGIGKICADAVVRSYHYPMIFEWKHPDSKSYRSNKYHWYTQSNTRDKLWQTARKWIKAGFWIIRSKNFLAEMQSFQKEEDDSKSAGHIQGEHDDELFAGMISLYCGHECDGDERGVIQIPLVEDKAFNPRYLMHCNHCGFEDGTDNPHEYYRCTKCGSVQVIGKNLESDPNADPVAIGDSLLDKLHMAVPASEMEDFNGPVSWGSL